jgi:hypothetical protein
MDGRRYARHWKKNGRLHGHFRNDPPPVKIELSYCWIEVIVGQASQGGSDE